jgi:hypothetical protein
MSYPQAINREFGWIFGTLFRDAKKNGKLKKTARISCGFFL